jgi:hypothetical protein
MFPCWIELALRGSSQAVSEICLNASIEIEFRHGGPQLKCVGHSPVVVTGCCGGLQLSRRKCS